MAQADYTPGEADDGLKPRRGEWLRGQNQAFRSALDGAPLEVSLGLLIETATAELGGDARCAFYMSDTAGETLHHVVGMPESSARQVDGFGIGAAVLADRSVVATAEPADISDVRDQPRWTSLAAEHGYRGCWSFPVETTAGELVGTFALYFPEPREARAEDFELAEALTACAAIVIAQDKARETLRENEAKYRGLFESIDTGYCVIEMLFDERGAPFDYRFLEANPAFVGQTGLSDAIGRTVRELAPEHEAFWFETYGRIARTGQAERFEHRADALDRWFSVFAFRIGDPDRHQVAILFEDIKDRMLGELALRESEARLRLLLGELQHRARNILAVVRSVFSRTVETTASTDELADHFRGRLDALARTQVVVTQNPRGTANLENVVRDELLSVGMGDGPRLSICGPEVELPGEAAEALGLVVHELTTNSIKYGALRFPEGTLDIRWCVNVDYGEPPHLVFSWEEQGVPAMLVDPGPEGFGTELINRALPYRLGAKTSFELSPGGVRCLIDIPLPRTAPMRGTH